MRTSTYLFRATLLKSAVLFALPACGGEEPDVEGGAELVIAGEPEIELDPREVAELEVEYVDAEGEPLAGGVEFSLEGEDLGEAALWDSQSLTDAHGVAQVTFDPNETGDYEATVEASAPDADPVAWAIEVEPLPPLDPTGTYAMESRFDVTNGLPGRAGSAVNLIISMTDDNADPTLWVLERVEEYLPDWVPDIVDRVPYAGIYAINSVILDNATGGFVSRFQSLGQDFGDIATNFGVLTELEVEGDPEGELRATHTVTGFVADYGGERREVSLEEDMGREEVVVSNIDVDLSEQDEILAIENHDLPVSYGALLVFALEDVLLGGEDLGSFLEDGVGCETMAEELADRYDFISSLMTGAISSACSSAISAGADRAIDRLLEVDASGVVLELQGDAVASEAGADRAVDALSEGHWEGHIHAARDSVEIAPEDATFSGERGSGSRD